MNGAIDLGLVPDLLPGRASLDSGRAWFTEAWGGVPEVPGFETSGILSAASMGRVAVLILLGADPLVDFPDPELAQAALAGAGMVIAVDLFVNDSLARAADVVLPAAAFGEVDGTHTNLEGRITPLRQKVTPPGTARPDWMIAAEIAARLGSDMGFTSVDDITDEIAAVSGLHVGADARTISQAADGVVVPIADAVDRPARSVWQNLGEPMTPSPFDSYSYRLVIDRTLYDRGTQTTACESLAGLAEGGVVRISRGDASRLGVDNGTTVRLSSKRASVEGRIEIDERVARGVAAVAHNRAGLDVRSLVEMGELVTDVRIETL